jgi:hypothetical protein
MGDITTSDYSTILGKDDTSDSHSEEALLSNPQAQQTSGLKEILPHILTHGYRGPQIIKIPKERHRISISIGTLNHQQKLWGLQQHQLPQGPSPTV